MDCSKWDKQAANESLVYWPVKDHLNMNNYSCNTTHSEEKESQNVTLKDDRELILKMNRLHHVHSLLFIENEWQSCYFKEAWPHLQIDKLYMSVDKAASATLLTPWPNLRLIDVMLIEG